MDKWFTIYLKYFKKMPLFFHRFSRLTLALATSVLSSCCPPPGMPTHATGAATSLVAPVERAAPGDVLHVDVAGEHDLTGDYTVAANGDIVMPLVGHVHVAGTPVTVLPNVIASAYRGDYLKDPQISVDVKGLPH